MAAAVSRDLRELESRGLEDPAEPARAILEDAHVNEHIAVQAGARWLASVLEAV